MLIRCTLYNDLRHVTFEKCQRCDTYFQNMSDEEKLIFILNVANPIYYGHAQSSGLTFSF